MTEARLQFALGHQRQMREKKIGAVLQDMGVITQAQLDEVVRIQMSNIADTTAGARQRIGQTMVQEGMITDDQLHLGLAQQRRNRSQRIGEVVVELRIITNEQLAKAVAIQMESISQD